MTFFGISLFDEVELPEFPFPDLGRPTDGEGAPERGAATTPPATSGARVPAWQRPPAPSGEGASML